MTEAGTVAAEGAVVAVTAAAAVSGVSQRAVGASLTDSTSDDEDGWQLGEQERTGVPSGESGSDEGGATSRDGVILSVVGLRVVMVTTLSVAKGVGSGEVDGISGPRW